MEVCGLHQSSRLRVGISPFLLILQILSILSKICFRVKKKGRGTHMDPGPQPHL